MKYGASVFEGIRAYWCPEDSGLRLLESELHLERLLESMKLMRMEVTYNVNQLSSFVEQLLLINSLRQDSYIRVSASITGEGGIDQEGPVLLGIVQSPKGRSPKYDSGIGISISSWVRINETMMPPRLKCVANYQNGRLAKLQAKLDGYDDTLLLNHLGYVSESPTACFCLVKNGMVFTPPVFADILPSITRKLLFRLAPTVNVSMAESFITRAECYLADEAFLCGTGAEVLPVHSIDHHRLTHCPGPITIRLRQAFEAFARGRGLANPAKLITL